MMNRNKCAHRHRPQSLPGSAASVPVHPALPPNSEPDPDPDGAKLAATSDPLGDASKLVEMLVRHAGGRLDSHLMAAEVALRKGRLVVAVGAVRKAAQVAADGAAHPDVHVLLVRLALAGEWRGDCGAVGGQAEGTAGPAAYRAACRLGWVIIAVDNSSLSLIFLALQVLYAVQNIV
jgi:hypothetical protein